MNFLLICCFIFEKRKTQTKKIRNLKTVADIQKSRY